MSAFDKLIEGLDTSSGVTWLECLVGPELISNASGKSDIIPTTSCSGKYIGLYFSAKWCGPCKTFTPVLRKSYEEWQNSGKHQFEIIFMSLDRTQPEFNVRESSFDVDAMLSCGLLLQVSLTRSDHHDPNVDWRSPSDHAMEDAYNGIVAVLACRSTSHQCRGWHHSN